MNDLYSTDISLDKESHNYTLQTDPGTEFTSVTTFVGNFFEEFDADKIAKKLVVTNPKYKGMTPESLVAEWASKRDHGTKVHEEIEDYIKSGKGPTYTKAIIGVRWLERYTMKSEFEIYPEVIVYSKELGIAGTVDILIKDKYSKELSILDWKTSRAIETSSYGGKSGIKPVTKDLLDCNFNHYALQMSFYRYLLEEYYGLQVSDQLIVHLEDEKAHGYLAPYMREHVISMLNGL